KYCRCVANKFALHAETQSRPRPHRDFLGPSKYRRLARKMFTQNDFGREQCNFGGAELWNQNNFKKTVARIGSRCDWQAACDEAAICNDHIIEVGRQLLVVV